MEKMVHKVAECMAGKTYGQITAMVDKHMKDHPESWHDPMADLILGAVRRACDK
jgi:hypothetical protein